MFKDSHGREPPQYAQGLGRAVGLFPCLLVLRPDYKGCFSTPTFPSSAISPSYIYMQDCDRANKLYPRVSMSGYSQLYILKSHTHRNYKN